VGLRFFHETSTPSMWSSIPARASIESLSMTPSNLRAIGSEVSGLAGLKQRSDSRQSIPSLFTDMLAI
ncbi:hypothetical protein PENTCL1PPCAC_4447, partial [Pristionchus entomophagus]